MTCRSLTVLSAILVKLLEFVFELKQRGSVVRVVLSASFDQVVESIWYAWSTGQLCTTRLGQHLQRAQQKMFIVAPNPTQNRDRTGAATSRLQYVLSSSSVT